MPEVDVVRGPRRRTAEGEESWGLGFPEYRGRLFNLNPFGLMRQFTDDMDRFFGNEPRFGGGELWRPAIEIKEEGGKLLVHAELPGVNKDEVKVSVDEDVLTIEGERKREKEEKREGYYHSERSYGKFSRSVRLPEGANADNITAQFNNGVLEITVPVTAKKPNRKEISVQEAPKSKTTAG